MFSWSHNSSGTSAKSSGSSNSRTTYPGARSLKHQGAVTAVDGTIRAPTDYSRAQHLQSFLEDSTLKRSTRRVSADDTTYDTVFQTTKADTLILRVNVPLASSFSSFCPAMTLAGVRARHPWIDSRMRIVGYNPLESEASWKASNLSLGQAVHAVVKHIQLNPPEVFEFTDSALQSIQSNSKRSSSNASAASSGTHPKTPPRKSMRQGQDQAPPSYDVFANSPKASPPNSAIPTVPPAPPLSLPTIPMSFPELDGMTREELDGLLEDELEFLSFVHKLPVATKLSEIENAELEKTATIAKENLAQESKLQDLSGEVKGLQSSLKAKVEEFTKLETEQNKLIQPPDIHLTIKALTKVKKESYDESEAFGDDWVDDIDKHSSLGSVDEFCKQFIQQRIIHHTRAAKLEVLNNNNSSSF